jgi:hypothetical protein
MTLQEKIQYFKENMYQNISTKEITLLKDLDNKIVIIKDGKYLFESNNCSYETFLELHHNKIHKILNDLDDKKVYILIPFISINNRPDEPIIILSQQILVTNYSNSLLITNYINQKIDKSFALFNIYNLEKFNIVLKYKQVEFKFKEYHKFD